MKEVWGKAQGRTTDGGRGGAGVDLHLEGAAIQHMLVEQLLPPNSHCSTCHLHTSNPVDFSLPHSQLTPAHAYFVTTSHKCPPLQRSLRLLHVEECLDYQYNADPEGTALHLQTRQWDSPE